MLGIFGLKLGYLFLTDIDLFSEEAQYWLWSKYPALAYYSKPPLIAWVNMASSWLMGDHEVVIRLNAILCGLLSSWFIYRLGVAVLASQRKAFLAVLLLNCLPFFWIHSLFFTTDSLLMVTWSAALYFFYQAWQTDQGKYWLGLGFALGLGLLAKLSMLFFLPILLAACFVQPELLKRTCLYRALVFAGFLFLPAFLGMLQADMVSLNHLKGLATENTDNGPLLHAHFYSKILEYLLGQMLILLPLIPFLRAVSSAGERKVWALTVLPAIVTFGTFFLLAFHKRPEINWPDVGYLGLPVAAMAAGSYPLRKIKWVPAILSACCIVLILGAGISLGESKLGIIPPESDPLQRLNGWKQLARQVQVRLDEMPEGTVLMCSNYQLASLLAFYLKRYPVYCLADGERRMNQFDLWQNPNEFACSGRRVLWVGDNPFPASLCEAFPAPISSESWPWAYRGKPARTYYVYAFSDFYGMEEDDFTRF